VRKLNVPLGFLRTSLKPWLASARRAVAIQEEVILCEKDAI
jgi:hypothetical protein